MGTTIQEMEIENLKMKILGLKNEISYPLWSDFIDWIIEEFEFNNENSEEVISDLEIEVEKLDNENISLGAEISNLENKLEDIKYDLEDELEDIKYDLEDEKSLKYIKYIIEKYFQEK